jgi:hypothetical protein
MKISIDDITNDDRSVGGFNFASIGDTFLNITKTAASFVVATFPEANCRHWNSEWNGEESPNDAHVVVTGMSWYISDDYTGPYTTNGEPDPLLIEFTVIHTGYSIPSNPDQRQPWHTTFARVVNNEVAASDSRFARGRMIQLDISGDIYTKNIKYSKSSIDTYVYI